MPIIFCRSTGGCALLLGDIYVSVMLVDEYECGIYCEQCHVGGGDDYMYVCVYVYAVHANV